jgi:hypothetical protein
MSRQQMTDEREQEESMSDRTDQIVRVVQRLMSELELAYSGTETLPDNHPVHFALTQAFNLCEEVLHEQQNKAHSEPKTVRFVKLKPTDAAFPPKGEQ